MLLENKNAIIYGGGGGVGRGVALAFAREGARVYLAGRNREKVEQAAAAVKSAGGSAEAAVVDALDEQAVEEYVKGVAAKAGSIDISFNLITRGDVQGIPLMDMRPADLTQAVMAGLTSQFLTSRAAARYMIKQGKGVILMLTSGSSVGAPPMMGSTPAADAAMEALMRGLATELGPQGVRVVGMWTAGVPETLTPEKISSVNENMRMSAEDLQRMLTGMAQMTMLRRSPALAQVADTAVFLASDLAGAITGTITNVTCGMVPG